MEKTIDECFFQIQNGANIKQGDVDGGYPITRIETTANDKFNRDRMGYAGITDLSKYESYVLEDGDLLMSHINSVQYLGRTVLYEKQENETIIHGMNLLRLKARRDIINPAYARYCFYGHLFRSQVANITKKSVNQASFAVKDLKQLKIDVPEMNRQNQIVEILNKTNELIGKRQQELDTLDELIKARFVELFNTGEYPLVPISELVAGKVQSVKKVFLPEDEIKYIDISSIDNKRNIMTGYTEYILSEAPSRAQQHIKKGDIVISTVRPNLRNVAMTSFDDNNLVASSGFCVLRASKCLPEYLLAIVCSDRFTYDMASVVTGANYPAIKDSDVMNYNVVLPPMELQEQFSDFVKQVDKSKVAVQKALDETQTLFDCLMQEYFG